MIGTSDGYSSNNMSVPPDHGNSNNNGTVMTHSVAVDDPPFENIDKQAVVLPVHPKHVKTQGGGSSSAVTGKKHNVPQTHGRSVQHGRVTRSVRRAEQKYGSTIKQGIWNAGTGPDVDDFEWNDDHQAYWV